MIHCGTLNVIPLKDYKIVCNCCTIYIVLFVLFLIVTISIISVFIYFHWYLKKGNIHVKFNTSTQITIY